MNRKTVKIIAIVIASVFLLTLCASLIGMLVYGQPAGSEFSLETLHQYESELSELSCTVYDLQQKLEDPEGQMERLSQRLEAAETEAEAAAGRFGRRFAVACERGSASSLELLLSAKTLSDYIDNTVTAQEIAAYDKQTSDELESARQAAEQAKNDLDAFRQNLGENRSKLREADTALSSKKAEAADFLARLQESGRYDAVMKDKTDALLALTREVGSTLPEPETPHTPDSLSLSWPAESRRIIRGYTEADHAGIDIGMEFGAGVFAAADGVVVFAGENLGYGNCIILDHSGILTFYGHLSALGVTLGQEVEGGYQIGVAGSTGSPAGPYLHFELIEGGSPINPVGIFDTDKE